MLKEEMQMYKQIMVEKDKNIVELQQVQNGMSQKSISVNSQLKQLKDEIEFHKQTLEARDKDNVKLKQQIYGLQQQMLQVQSENKRYKEGLKE